MRSATLVEPAAEPVEGAASDETHGQAGRFDRRLVSVSNHSDRVSKRLQRKAFMPFLLPLRSLRPLRFTFFYYIRHSGCNLSKGHTTMQVASTGGW
jgi:hypothetical protein